MALCFRVSVEKLFFWDGPSASKTIQCIMGGICKQPVHIVSYDSKLRKKAVVEGLRLNSQT